MGTFFKITEKTEDIAGLSIFFENNLSKERIRCRSWTQFFFWTNWYLVSLSEPIILLDETWIVQRMNKDVSFHGSQEFITDSVESMRTRSMRTYQFTDPTEPGVSVHESDKIHGGKRTRFGSWELQNLWIYDTFDAMRRYQFMSE